MTNWVALFGGTFDPPHLGHRQAVRGLFEVPGVARVKVLPAPIPPLKTSQATAAQRLAMARLNFGSVPGDLMPAEIEIDARELDRSIREPGRPSYTFDTLQEIAREIPRQRLAFVIGTDQLLQLPQWYRFPEVLELSHWIVLERKPNGGVQGRGMLQDWAGSGLVRTTGIPSQWLTRSGRELRVVPTEARELSSTAIRETIARTGNAPGSESSPWLLPEVLSYLKTHRIYAIKADS